MIFICAQPTEPYFFWQLEVQLFNFKRLGVDLSKVHQVFISQNGETEEYKKYKAAHPEVNIHCYPDTRTNKKYIPSMRPNALKKHYEAFPELEKEDTFYHDADIILRCIPDFDKMDQDNTWYMSDTNSYVNADYINSKGDTILDEMTAIVGITRQQVEAVNSNSGGAQYFMKGGVTKEFWDKLEKDCIALYDYMISTIPHWAEKFSQKTGQPKENYHEIQAWCSDMFCVLWAGVLLGKEVKITPLLDFSWATGTIESYHKAPIFHNAGVIANDRERLFYKGDYLHRSPFDFDFSFVSSETASYMYVKEMKDYLESIK